MLLRPDADGLRRVMALAPSPVAVVTGRDPAGEPVGMTVSSLTSVSLAPPLVLISVAAGSSTWARIAPAGRFAVNLLGAGDEELARRFASRTERFGGVGYDWSAHGLPLLHAAPAAAEFSVVRVDPAGDHDLVLGELVSARIMQPRAPLVHHRSAYATTVPLAAVAGERAA